jgi:hypothetical protein
MNIEAGRDYTTRDGRKVRVHAVGGRGTFSIRGSVYIAGVEPRGYHVCTDLWTATGFYHATRSSGLDIMHLAAPDTINSK